MKAPHEWAGYADSFDSLDEYTHILPALSALLGPVQDRRVLDLGCSNGVMSRLLARQGARMTGVDISDHAIGIARDLSERQDLPVDYHLADARDLSEFQDASFDLVLAVNSLCSFGPDRSVMGEISAEIHRLLTPGGALVAVIPHPAFEHQQNCPTRHRRFPDGYSYFNGGTLNTLSLTINQKKAEFDNTHWTLEDYSGFFRDRFLISDICEPVPDDTFDAVHPEMFAQATRYPIYMLLKCVACPK